MLDFRAKTKKELEEEKNTMHVAITRAERILYLTYPQKQKEYPKQKSRFLKDVNVTPMKQIENPHDISSVLD